MITVRLACVKHAASVRPEPGSNSPLMSKHPPHQKAPRANFEPLEGPENLTEVKQPALKELIIQFQPKDNSSEKPNRHPATVGEDQPAGPRDEVIGIDF